MEEQKYTLNDDLFRYAVQEGAESEAAFDDGRIMVVGGAATQLVTEDRPDLFRPTTDVDVIVDKPTGKPERRQWAEYVATSMRDKGHDVEGELSRYGASVRFGGLRTDFLLHLDCFGSGFYNRHKERLDREFDRAKDYDIRHQCPMDIVINKMRRMTSLLKRGDVRLTGNEKDVMRIIEEGFLNDLYTDDLPDQLKRISHIRKKNLEDLGREGYPNIIEQVNHYKVQKDIYDIHSIVAACKRKGIEVDPHELRDGLKLGLIE